MKYLGVSGVQTGYDVDGASLLDLPDVQIDDRGRVAAAEALGVNYRTVARCQRSRPVSRRMRQKPVDFHDGRSPVDAVKEAADDEEPVDAGGNGSPDGGIKALRQRVSDLEVSDLENENSQLWELAAGRGRQLEELTRLGAAPESIGDEVCDTGAVEAVNVPGDGVLPGIRPAAYNPPTESCLRGSAGTPLRKSDCVAEIRTRCRRSTGAK